MKLDARIKGGLAWAGLVAVLAVPSAELLFGKAEPRAMLTSDSSAVPPKAGIAELKVDPVETASIEKAATKDPVSSYVESGKPLPSYISDAPAVTAPKAPVALKPAVPAPNQVAALPPAATATETPPVPLPRSMRPKAAAVANVTPPAKTVTPAAPAPKVAVTQPPVTQPPAPIVDERALAQRNAAISRQVEDTIITEDKLEEWDSGSLADYLARKGLLSGSGNERVSQDDEVYYNDRPARRLRNGTDTGFFLF